jgi:trehalose 6-phosphate synthase/phosphatase
MSTIINISNRLPVTLDGGEVKKSSGGLVSALESLAADPQALKWIGWPGKAGEDPQERKKVEKMLRDDMGYVPVFLSDEEIEGYYQGFANSSLWPLLHYMPTKFRYMREWWDHYLHVNQRFADAALSIAKEGDLVWVHDYQLMLVPTMLKKEMPSLKVGFFLHTPFPASEIFRCQPKRQELLEGLVGADQIGFHTFAYLRHFRGALLRLLGAEAEVARIHYEGHTTHLGVYPIGINASKYAQVLESQEYRTELAELKQTHEGKRIVFSVERLDYTKGILRRLDAIDLFFEHRGDRENIRFIFVSVPSREEVAEYKELREEVESGVGRLNGKYSTLHNTPIHFIYGSVDFTRLCAMYSLAEVALVTPLVDGMNLVAKEYVACQKDNPGVLVLSEFAGAAEELYNAIQVNPFDPQGVADALAHALDMPLQERIERMTPMRERVMTCDAVWWAKSFIDDLASRETIAETAIDDPARVADVRRRLVATLHRGDKVALYLDYDGTLREIERDPAAARPNTAVRELLGRLSSVPNLEVTLISGRRAREMEAWFGDYPIALIAEHGAEIRRPRETQWDRLDRHVNYSWKQDVLKVLRLYADFTPGSFVEEKRTGLVWHYRKADPEFGAWKAHQLVDELSTILANEPVVIRHGKKIVEIAATQVSKGAAVARLLEESHPALALAAGDDQTDESMFDLRDSRLVTIKIGRGETKAQLRLSGPAEFRRFLMDAIAESSVVGAS